MAELFERIKRGKRALCAVWPSPDETGFYDRGKRRRGDDPEVFKNRSGEEPGEE